MRVLACQIAVSPMTKAKERDAHLDRVAGLIDAALAERPADLVVTPELGAIDYARASFACLADLAEDLEGASFQRFAALATRHATTICYGFARRDADGGHRICQAAVGPGGRLLGHYDKLHLAQYGASMEKDYFTKGAGLFVFEAAGWRVAPTICYDIRFPELFRRLALDEGVDLILHPTAFFRDESFPSWHPFVLARAVENQVYFLSVNRAGADWGRSILVPPWCDDAHPATILGDGEELRGLSLGRQALEAARRDYHFRADRRGDYGTLDPGQVAPGAT